MKNNHTLVTAEGGQLHALSPDGEVLFSVPVGPGRHAASEFLALHGGEWQAEGVTIVAPRQLGGVTVHPEWTDTGANPDFVPTSATALELEMRRQVETLKMLNNTAARQIAARESIVEMRMAKKAEADADADADGDKVVE